MAVPSRRLTAEDAAIVKALLRENWLQSDVASLLGCNIGRISEIATGTKFHEVNPADLTGTQTAGRLACLQLDWTLRISRQLAAALRPAGTMI